MGKIIFGIVGGGWRTEFFLRIARALPKRFYICGMVVRNIEKARKIEGKWGVKTYQTIDDLLKEQVPSFMVVSVPRTVAPEITRLLAERGMPVLSETPPASDLKSLIELYDLIEKGAKIQVAEQYQFQPLHAARLAFAKSGQLGTINQVQVSVCHWYHAISLIRKFLDINFENVTISARSFSTPLTEGPGRNGDPTEETIKLSNQVIATLDFGEKLAIYDFTDDQYFSWIRSQRFLVRGEKGEIHDEQIRYLKNFKTPVQINLNRQDAGQNGNLEGYYLKGILAGEEWIYKNPFVPGRLTDDEIAIATCLEKMDEYVQGGSEFYSLAEAAQDHYIALMVDQAVRTKEKVTTVIQPWASFTI